MDLSSLHPLSDKLIAEEFPKFSETILKRLKIGADLYGDNSFIYPNTKLLREIEEELLDVCGWSFILWCKIHNLHQKMQDLNPSP